MKLSWDDNTHEKDTDKSNEDHDYMSEANSYRPKSDKEAYASDEDWDNWDDSDNESVSERTIAAANEDNNVNGIHPLDDPQDRNVDPIVKEALCRQNRIARIDLKIARSKETIRTREIDRENHPVLVGSAGIDMVTGMFARVGIFAQDQDTFGIRACIVDTPHQRERFERVEMLLWKVDNILDTAGAERGE